MVKIFWFKISVVSLLANSDLWHVQYSLLSVTLDKIQSLSKKSLPTCYVYQIHLKNSIKRILSGIWILKTWVPSRYLYFQYFLPSGNSDVGSLIGPALGRKYPTLTVLCLIPETKNCGVQEVSLIIAITKTLLCMCMFCHSSCSQPASLLD